MVKRRRGKKEKSHSARVNFLEKWKQQPQLLFQLLITTAETETGIIDLDYTVAHVCYYPGLQSFARLTALQETQKPI